jgi:hypothetical protein
MTIAEILEAAECEEGVEARLDEWRQVASERETRAEAGREFTLVDARGRVTRLSIGAEYPYPDTKDIRRFRDCLGGALAPLGWLLSVRLNVAIEDGAAVLSPALDPDDAI